MQRRTCSASASILRTTRRRCCAATAPRTRSVTRTRLLRTGSLRTGTNDQVKEIAQYFGLTYYPEKDQIIHGLRTVIVNPDGKVAKIYTGNEWKPEEVVEELKKISDIKKTQ